MPIARCCAALFLCLAALAQAAYPEKPVRMVIPFPPGGSNDVVGRYIAAELGKRLDRPVIVENVGGAGGLIGTGMVAEAAPDGYTILLISVAFAFNPAIYKTPYDPATAFAPVAMLGSGPVVIAVTPKLPANSLRDLIAMAKDKPGQLNYASAGVGSFQHLAAELFKHEAAVNIVHIPFKGGGPAMMDVIAGNTQVAVGSLAQMVPQIKGGKLKALAVGSRERIAALPEVPTISEAGLPGYEATNWWGVVAPAGTPRAIIERLHKELTAIIGSADTRKRFEAEGADALPMSSAEFGRFISVETSKWARVVKDAGIRAE
ncbi:MAG TPA: tripartite tricarboxylate transporter substrate binding protein [Usitatibacter sp.]|nr:tripartite tricarboxylate transporter substrate binding protein [Usitatibacter sp.]